ncbi:MAG: insulinase family protein, partial [Verrucomicrobiae bacterium]|nr:insulinase family protein [Verrucomicrobiae bacterium]
MINRYLKLLSLAFLIMASLAPLSAQLDKPLPFDPDVTKGKLDNGLTYYTRENREPENRAAFRLVVDAGSILEKEDTRGLAHFLEHMAFNGTKHFEKQELVEFLEGIGMRFGADLNAYTSFDETVYMLEIPMDDEEILEKTFQILEDWAHEISFEPEEIEKERGVVLEEWRLRLGAQNRIMDKQIPVLLHDSRYAERLPIGKPEIIQSVDRDDFVE